MSQFWTNASALSLAAEDPEIEIVERAQRVVLEAIEDGWAGPPFDPFELARLRGLDLVAREDLYDARVLALGGGMRIEYNPARPIARQRYSVAHEIAHTLFPDVADTVRYRSGEAARPSDDWQLELLCNLAAAELLMPLGAFPDLDRQKTDVEQVLELRREFEVSIEAVLLRMAKLSRRPVAAFAASRTDGSRLDSSLRLEYLRGSRAWRPRLAPGRRLPSATALSAVTAIGFTASGTELWPGGLAQVRIEGIGLPPYPGQRAPRVAGLVHPRGHREAEHTGEIIYVRGDATLPRGRGPHLVAHVVNDRTANWGGQFARALRDRHPAAQEHFRTWVSSEALRLGATHIAEAAPGVWVASMVAQAGYGPAKRPRLRYVALRECLLAVSEAARNLGAQVHMPRIGAGQAGGRWPVIEELIDEVLAKRGVVTTVYSLPGEPWPLEEHQLSLALG